MNIQSQLPHLVVISICIVLSIVPVLVWGYIFWKKHPEGKKLVMITFIAGILSVVPLLIYKSLWSYFPWINAFVWTSSFETDILGFSHLMLIPIPVILTFMFVGVIEEVSKLMSMKIADSNKLRNIDDAIELAIIAALGFAFVENIIYFSNIISVRGLDHVFIPFIFRSIFSTFAHIMFSGVFGYFYGVAHFADPIYREEVKKNRHPILKFIHKHFHIKGNVLFQDEKILEGLLAATALHAFFNIFLEMEWAFLIIPYLAAGYLTLNHLFKKKENLKKYGKVMSR